MKGIEMKEIPILACCGNGKYILERLNVLVSGRECFDLPKALV